MALNKIPGLAKMRDVSLLIQDEEEEEEEEEEELELGWTRWEVASRRKEN